MLEQKIRKLLNMVGERWESLVEKEATAAKAIDWQKVTLSQTTGRQIEMSNLKMGNM